MNHCFPEKLDEIRDSVWFPNKESKFCIHTNDSLVCLTSLPCMHLFQHPMVSLEHVCFKMHIQIRLFSTARIFRLIQTLFIHEKYPGMLTVFQRRYFRRQFGEKDRHICLDRMILARRDTRNCRLF